MATLPPARAFRTPGDDATDDAPTRLPGGNPETPPASQDLTHLVRKRRKPLRNRRQRRRDAKLSNTKTTVTGTSAKGTASIRESAKAFDSRAETERPSPKAR